MACYKRPLNWCKAQVLSRTSNISQGTGQSRMLTPSMYKVYVNGLLSTLTQHSYALSNNSLKLTSPSFADNISLLALYPTFPRTFMNICYAYSVKWRYEFNHVKSGIVTFGGAKHLHRQSMNENERDWVQEIILLTHCMNRKTLVL